VVTGDPAASKVAVEKVRDAVVEQTAGFVQVPPIPSALSADGIVEECDAVED